MKSDCIDGAGFCDRLSARGVTRRTFLKFCGGVALALGWSASAAPKVAQALEIGASRGDLAPVLWLEAGSCSGCTESLAQSSEPDVASIVLDMISMNYSEALSAAAGHSLERAKEETIEAGGYILVYEGAVMTGWDGNALRVAGEKGTEILAHAAQGASVVLACGSCAVDGGWQAAYPNPGGAIGVEEFLSGRGIDVPVVNIPACPANPENVVSVLVSLLMMGSLPDLDSKNMPAPMFSQTIHENCPRRGHFEAGEFVREFGSEEEALGYCLYPLGCRGPQTYSNCASVRWNAETSWCVESGAPCCGCAQATPGTSTRNWVDSNVPFQGSRYRDYRIGGLTFQVEPVMIGLTGVVVAALVIHGFGMKKAGRTASGGGVHYEQMSEYDTKQAAKRLAAQGGPGRKSTEVKPVVSLSDPRYRIGGSDEGDEQAGDRGVRK